MVNALLKRESRGIFWLTTNLDRLGYGSKFDGVFELISSQYKTF